MIYEENEFNNLEILLIDYAKHSLLTQSILKSWTEECNRHFPYLEKKISNYLKYADARKKLASMFQDSLSSFEEKEWNDICKLMQNLISFSDGNDIAIRTNMQKAAWFLNNMLKKYNFNHWEILLRDIGQDDTDMVRNIYQYLKKWENRMEAADTLYEYLVNKTLDEIETEEALRCIQILEVDL